MKQIYDHPQDVLRFCAAHPDAALCVVTNVTGGTLRAPGAMMAITDGDVAGYVSNGCVDADIVTRARSGQSGVFTYGEGSPFRDITLPCGGMIEVTLVQRLCPEMLSACLAELDVRRATTLKLETLAVNIAPRLRIRIAGRGAASLALMDLAESAGFETFLQSPDADIHSEAEHLVDPLQVLIMTDDAWTAVVLLFHDHDWEPELLSQAIKGPAFYIGAMGSARTHSARRESLLASGFALDQIDRIRGPIGLIPAQRDARSLALSILAEIMQVAQTKRLT